VVFVLGKKNYGFFLSNFKIIWFLYFGKKNYVVFVLGKKIMVFFFQISKLYGFCILEKKIMWFLFFGEKIMWFFHLEPTKSKFENLVTLLRLTLLVGFPAMAEKIRSTRENFP
jgi:hypothetical protein